MVCDGYGSASIGYELRIPVAFVQGTPLQDDCIAALEVASAT